METHKRNVRNFGKTDMWHNYFDLPENGHLITLNYAKVRAVWSNAHLAFLI